MILGYGIIAVPTGNNCRNRKELMIKSLSIKNHVRNAVPKIIPMLTFALIADIPLTPLIYEAIPAMHYNSSSSKLYLRYKGASKGAFTSRNTNLQSSGVYVAIWAKNKYETSHHSLSGPQP
jgi:hypothetical protein